MSALRQASEALCLQDMTLLEFGAGVLSGDGLRDSTHPPGPAGAESCKEDLQ